MADPIALKALTQGVTAGMKAELAAIAPDLLTDPDVKIYYDPAKTEIAEREYADNTDIEVAYFPNVKTVGAAAFRNCTNLVAVVLPKAQSVPKGNAFYGCSKLRRMDFPELTGNVGGQFASKCATLETVSLPKITELSMGAEFQYCYALRDVYLPELVKLAASSFDTCSALTKLDLPKLTYLNWRAFNKTALQTLILRADVVCELDGTFRPGYPISDGTGYIYVPSALIEDYKAATNWSTYAAQFRAIEDYPDICGTDLDEPITKGEAVQMVKEAGSFIVTATPGDALEDVSEYAGLGVTSGFYVTMDKTFDEVLAAFKAGRAVVCKDTNGNVYQVNACSDTGIVLSRQFFSTFQMIVWSTDIALLLTND